MVNQLKTLLLLGLLSALLVGFGGMLGKGFLTTFTLIALAMNIGAYYFSDKLVLKMHRARELTQADSPRLFQMVQQLASRAGVPTPRLYVIEGDQPNAFATGRNPKHAAIAVTEGIRNLLDERQLMGVLAHEMAHIKNRDILITTIAAVMGTAISHMANIVQWGALLGSGRSQDEEGHSAGGGLLMAFVAPIAAMIIQLAVSRSREYLADATGAELCRDPDALASALERLEYGTHHAEMATSPAFSSLFIVNPFGGLGGMMANLFSTHPPIKERVRRLRAMVGVGATRSFSLTSNG